jgi:hypothetical protein
MLECNAVIIYGTKTGVELTSMGRPVIVAGEAWIRNKGLTLDATSRDNYFHILDGLPLPSAGWIRQRSAGRAAMHIISSFAG